MPRRAAPGNRAAIEAALSDAQRAALAECCRDHGVPPDRWLRVAAWVPVWTAMAAANLVCSFDAARGSERAYSATSRST